MRSPWSLPYHPAIGKENKGPVSATAIVAITDDNGMFRFGIQRPGA
jgi:hypothetical protein